MKQECEIIKVTMGRYFIDPLFCFWLISTLDAAFLNSGRQLPEDEEESFISGTTS